MAVVAAIAIPAFLLGGGEPRDVATTVPPVTTTAVPPDATTTVPPDATTTPTTTTVPPGTTTTLTTISTPVRPGYIQGVPEGASCAQLAESGYTYPEVVAYWMRWERPEDSVPEISAPCSDHFIAEDIEAVYGPEDSLEVRIVSRKGGAEDYTFAASGPAVDAGLICPSGTVVINIQSHNYYDYNRGALFRAHRRWDDEYTCDDGTGTFILGADVFIDAEDLGAVFDADDSSGVWSIVSGTGRYEDLAGGGGSFTYDITEPGPGFEYFWSDVLEGRLWIPVDQPES